VSLALIFPGQGSQKLGMLADFFSHYGVIRSTFKQAEEVLGVDLWQICQTGPEEKINSTEITQPLLLTASYALYLLGKEESFPLPEFVAGHSLGEYTALVVANVLSFSDAVALVQLRGQLMQKAVPEGIGSMAAVIGLNDEQVILACDKVNQSEEERVEAVNFNAPGQIVIAGKSHSVQKAGLLLKDLGARRVLPLAVSVPAHSSLMKPAADQLKNKIDKLHFSQPVIPVVQNVSANPVTDLSELKHNLVQQLYSPVLWSQTIKELAKQGVDTMVECGPGKVLSGLNKRIDNTLKNLSMDSVESLKITKENLMN